MEVSRISIHLSLFNAALLDVMVNIVGGDRIVEEDDGFVKICMSLDHVPLVPVSITINTADGTALGK